MHCPALPGNCFRMQRNVMQYLQCNVLECNRIQRNAMHYATKIIGVDVVIWSLKGILTVLTHLETPSQYHENYIEMQHFEPPQKLLEVMQCNSMRLSLSDIGADSLQYSAIRWNAMQFNAIEFKWH